jgi:hypothetical protein
VPQGTFRLSLVWQITMYNGTALTKDLGSNARGRGTTVWYGNSDQVLLWPTNLNNLLSHPPVIQEELNSVPGDERTLRPPRLCLPTVLWSNGEEMCSSRGVPSPHYSRKVIIILA